MVKRVKYNEIPVKKEKITKLKEVIDKQSIQWNEDRRAQRGDKPRTLYASDYGQCMRKVWYQFFPDKHPIRDFSPRTLRIFHNGESVHERLSGYLRKEKELNFIEEIDVPRDELDVHGRCDGICTIDNQPTVVEFKSINRASVLKPKDEHVGQLLWYIMMWKAERERLEQHKEQLFPMNDKLVNWILSGKEIVGELIYESKQTNETHHFPITYKEKQAKIVRLWFETLNNRVKNRTVPDVQYNGKKFPCKWGRNQNAVKCPYYDLCWNLCWNKEKCI